MKRIASFLKRRDQLGVPVHFLFKGEDTHKTVFGGLCSCLGTIFNLALTFSVVIGFITEPEYM